MFIARLLLFLPLSHYKELPLQLGFISTGLHRKNIDNFHGTFESGQPSDRKQSITFWSGLDPVFDLGIFITLFNTVK